MHELKHVLSEIFLWSCIIGFVVILAGIFYFGIKNGLKQGKEMRERGYELDVLAPFWRKKK